MKQNIPYANTGLYTFGDKQTYSELLSIVQSVYACYHNDKELQICVQAFGFIKHQLHSRATTVILR